MNPHITYHLNKWMGLVNGREGQGTIVKECMNEDKEMNHMDLANVERTSGLSGWTKVVFGEQRGVTK